ncbi:hypothetical protein AY535_01750 [Corynebacterium diphtheriae bv. gravis]|nr:hypothetical protein AY535_01750 [Corynebacterium diphtheriae bv. gravis]
MLWEYAPKGSKYENKKARDAKSIFSIIWEMASNSELCCALNGLRVRALTVVSLVLTTVLALTSTLAHGGAPYRLQKMSISKHHLSR